MLLTKGAKASARGPEGKTALMLAAVNLHPYAYPYPYPYPYRYPHPHPYPYP